MESPLESTQLKLVAGYESYGKTHLMITLLVLVFFPSLRVAGNFGNRKQRKEVDTAA